MKLYYYPLLVLMVILGLGFSCENRQQEKSQAEEENKNAEGRDQQAGPPVIIYKTKSNYFDKVPVILTPDKKEITSYPDVRDVYRNGEYSYPTALNGEYLLDNRGINENVAFLKLTYGDYSKLEKTPTKSELIGLVLDNDPLTEMYHCGNKFLYKDLVKEINEIITKGDLGSFRRLK